MENRMEQLIPAVVPVDLHQIQVTKMVVQV